MPPNELPENPMLSLQTARALKKAGLVWTPAAFDFFAIPDRSLDDHLFVISQMPAAIATLQGQPVVTFEGAVEWALDYIATIDVVWVPTETQLREHLAARLLTDAEAQLELRATADRCWCEVVLPDGPRVFEAANGSEAYAAALLYLLAEAPPSA
jgi:hypothetical protein